VLNIDLSLNFHPSEDSDTNLLLKCTVTLRSCGSYLKIILYKQEASWLPFLRVTCIDIKWTGMTKTVSNLSLYTKHKKKKAFETQSNSVKDCYMQVLILLHFSFALWNASLKDLWVQNKLEKLTIYIIYVLHSLKLPSFLHEQCAKVQN